MNPTPDKAIRDAQEFVRIIFFAVLKFYNIVLNDADIKKHLVINMVTGYIMKKQVYSVIMNSLLLKNAERVKKIQKNLNKYKYKVSLEKLGVSKYF